MNIFLTEEERETVRAQRVRLFGPLDKRERPSVVLRVRGDGEVEFIYAYSRRVATRRTSRIDVMAVATTATDSDRIFYRNLRFYSRAGYRVDDWAARPDGQSQGIGETRPDGVGEIPGPVANPEALRGARPCYRHAGIYERCWDVRPAAYLRMLRECPAAELLFKAGFTQLLRPSILKRAREMAPFIARHRREIDRLEAGASAVMEAWRKGIAVEEAVARETARHDLRGCPRAPGVDVLEIARWFRKAKITQWEYRRHCEHCAELGLGAEAYMPSPKRFRAFAERVEAEVAEAKRRKERRDAAALAAAFRKKQLGAAAFCPKTKGVAALWPHLPKQLEDEGRAMRNCIGNGLYVRHVAEGEAAIVFLREAASPDVPWCDVELKLDGGKWWVTQCYARLNQTAPEAAKAAATAIAEALTKAAQRKARKAKKENRRVA